MKNWNADEWHLFLCQHCDNRATSPNGLNKVALAIVDEIDDVTAAKRRALTLADERAKEANELRAEVERLRKGLKEIVDFVNPLPRAVVREACAELLREKPKA